MRQTRPAAVAFISLSFASAVQANVDPRDLRATAYCLTHSPFEFIARSNEVIRANVYSDGTSRPHERHLFVFVGRRRGVYDGFDVRISRIAAVTRYEIVNNATLKRRGDDVVFISPQLGGVWAQGQFKRDFLAALADKSTLMRVPKQRPRDVMCTSYADQANAH